MKSVLNKILKLFGFGPETKSEAYWAYKDGYQIRDEE